MTTRRAECSCGQLSATCAGEPGTVAVCHCLACKRRSGSAFGLSAWWPVKDVSFAGQAAHYVRVGDDGGRIDHVFCPACGVTVGWTIDGLKGVMAIAVGTFADMSFPPPAMSMYHDSRGYPWLELRADPIFKRG